MNDTSSDDILQLKQRLAEQEALNQALLEKLASREREIDYLQAQLDKLRRMNFGSRSEKVSRRIAQMEADLNKVIMLLRFNVVIDIHLRFFNMQVAPWMYRQRAKRGLIQSCEGFPAIAGNLFEGVRIEAGNQRTDTVVQLRQREEDLVT